MAHPDLGLKRGGGGGGLVLLVLLASLPSVPSVISSFFTQNKGAQAPRSGPPLAIIIYHNFRYKLANFLPNHHGATEFVAESMV